jgi:small subunit ribosomal protein S8
MSDPIADMFNRIRNATMRERMSVSIPHSQMKERVAEVLKEEGYIDEVQIIPDEPQPALRLRLKYTGGRRNRRPVIAGIKRVSRPGRRMYVGKSEIPWVLSGMGIAILTTSQGIMTDQKARRLGVGGEVICEVW